jgi:hypothetical protein
MQSHYEICVSLKGSHLFATAPRSCVSEQDMTRALGQISRRFPEAEGFKITVTHWECRGRKVIA